MPLWYTINWQISRHHHHHRHYRPWFVGAGEAVERGVLVGVIMENDCLIIYLAVWKLSDLRCLRSCEQVASAVIQHRLVAYFFLGGTRESLMLVKKFKLALRKNWLNIFTTKKKRLDKSKAFNTHAFKLNENWNPTFFIQLFITKSLIPKIRTLKFFEFFWYVWKD